MCRVIYKLGDDVSTDNIYPGRFMATMLPNETPQYAFADIPELNKHFNKCLNTSIQMEEVIVTGENFGCGSSREQAVSTLVGNKVIVVAKSFARIFKQNAVNLGLRIFTCQDIEVSVGDKLEFLECVIKNATTNKQFKIGPLAESSQAVLDAGGLIPYTRNRLQERPKNGLLKRLWNKIKEQI